MTTRDRYISEGIIRPNQTATRTVRQSLIDNGKVRPCDNAHKSFDVDRLCEKVNMQAVMRDFLIRATGHG